MILSGQAYVCSQNETFDLVALAVYGNEKYSADLLNANPSLCEKLIFDGGEILNLPVVEVYNIDNEENTPLLAPWKE